MRVLTWVAVAMLAMLTIAAPVSARVVRIETAVALTDQSEASIEEALRRAFDDAVRGLRAMGLSTMWVDGARVLPNAVVLALYATDEQLDDTDEQSDDEDRDPKPALRM